ncbi:hypothetical protein KIN20_022203 [Parelaphostrongylus tenuis]|uniref:Platelet-derived growth factor (PDGF) family profile domain-containing protein n=1 Tax=Parelaphostrongylus tenuis TaxID=148309 RepID=A0AAD5MPV9_PARTN|nr:hypothetical protein KIN20_022203 [Parelaphostrongylus tenuis]
MRSMLLAFLVTWAHQVQSETIPKHLRDQLNKAKSFLEIAENMEILYHPLLTNKHIQKSYTTEGPRQPIRIKAANFLKSSPSRLRTMVVEEPKIGNNAMDVQTTEHLSLFGSIMQGNDTCQLQSVCVPIRNDNRDPQVVLYPKCYEVMQCTGSCCDESERCHPQSVRIVEKPVIEMLYIGNNKFILNQTLNESMEEHTSCSCYDCGPDVPECPPGFAIGTDCKCQCMNKSDRYNCQGNHKWNEDKCRCECEPIECERGQTFDELDRCACVHKQKRDEVPIEPDVDSLPAVDLSSLPKLKARVVHHNPGIRGF